MAKMRQENAETIAAQALGWLAQDDDLLMAFLGQSGADLADLRQNAGNPDFLGGVLDFVLSDDARTQAFAAATGLPPNAPGQARQSLPGGGQTHWT